MEIEADLQSLLGRPPTELEPWDTSEVLVYGGGGCGRLCAAIMRQRGVKVAGFIDQKAAAGASVDGIPAFPLASPKARKYTAEGCRVILGVFNHFTNVFEISRNLAAAGFTRIVTFYEFCERFEVAEHNRYWVAHRGYWREHAKEVLAAFRSLEDDASRRLFVDALRLRMEWDLKCLSTPDQKGQYLPPDLPPPVSPVRLVDGGAYTGDTLEAFEARGLRLEAIAAFEPDAANFTKLVRSVGAQSAPEKAFFPCGLGDRTEVLRFNSDQGLASSIGQGTGIIQVVSLDEAVPGFRPTFIKLDIEGAELAALQGMKHTLQSADQVRMAVCVYHRPSHFWEVPLLLKQLLPGRTLHLRSHGHCGFDLVAYALQSHA